MPGVKGEAEAFRPEARLFRDPHRVVWQVSGDRSIDALNGLLTNDLRRPEPGSVIPCLALTPKGRPLADLQVWKRPAGSAPILLDLPAAGAGALREHLDRYLPPRFAKIEALPQAALFCLVGPHATNALRLLFGNQFAVPPSGRFEAASLEPGDVLVAGRTEAEGAGWQLLAPANGDEIQAALRRAVEAKGGAAVDDEEWETFRIEQGIPRYGIDFDLENLPQETGLSERTLSFDKGCYTGQEVVARIHYRGHVNRRLAGLVRAGTGTNAAAADPIAAAAELIPAGTELYLDGRPVGTVSSSALSARFGPIALGMIRREVEPGARLAASPGGEASIELRELPFTSA